MRIIDNAVGKVKVETVDTGLVEHFVEQVTKLS